MKLFFIIIICNLSPILLFSQNETPVIYIKGKIKSEANVPLSYSTVLNIKDKTGTQADKNGDYILAIEIPATVSISHIGFETREINITRDMLKDSLNDTLEINIFLKNAIKELKPIEISAEKLKLIYDKPNTTILDYEFINDDILLLVSENKKNKLRLININADSIINDTILKFKADELFRDCFNNIQLLGKDSSYQLYIIAPEIHIYRGYPIKQFNSLVLPCVASASEMLYFREYGGHNQSVIYYAINKATKNKKLLTNINNTEKGNFAEQELKCIAQLKKEWGNPNVMGNISAEALRAAREIEHRQRFYNSILTRPTYHPLKKIRDSVFIFNHISDSVYVYKSTELDRSFPVKYHYEQGWKNEIITDASTQSAYAKFINDGMVYLYQINLDNGSILNQYKLAQHTFPENIKINNDYAYYLYTDSKADFPKKRLYRQRLE